MGCWLWNTSNGSWFKTHSYSLGGVPFIVPAVAEEAVAVEEVAEAVEEVAEEKSKLMLETQRVKAF